MINKEKNFVSAVIYVRNDEKLIKDVVLGIDKVLYDNFEKYEIICVDDASKDNSIKEINNLKEVIKTPILKSITMSYFQGTDTAMNAGRDNAIGDFVFEIDTLDVDFEYEFIMELYRRSLQGYDIVSGVPNTNIPATSKMFYSIFNKFSNLNNPIQTERVRILSRRSINRIDSLNKKIIYRKASYARCGLAQDHIKYESKKTNQSTELDREHHGKQKDLAIYNILLFSDLGFKASIFMLVAMMLVTIFVGVYTIFTYVAGSPVEGWTTTMLLLSVVFFAIFAILAIIVKYLEIIVSLLFDKGDYVISNINKIK